MQCCGTVDIAGLHIKLPLTLFHLSMCSFGGCFPSRMKVTRTSADDLCVIIINRGIVEDHLPNEVRVAAIPALHTESVKDLATGCMNTVA